MKPELTRLEIKVIYLAIKLKTLQEHLEHVQTDKKRLDD